MRYRRFRRMALVGSVFLVAHDPFASGDRGSCLIHNGQKSDRILKLNTEAESLLGSKAGLIIAW